MENNTYEFNSFDYIDKDRMIKTTISEVNQLEELGKIGFPSNAQDNNDNKLRFEFNPTSFAEYFSTCVLGRLLESGDIALYRRNDGYYELVDELVLGKLVMVLMTQGGQKLWSKSRETQSIEGYRRILNEMVVQFDTEDIINVKNGIFDLKTRKLEHHDPKYLCLGQIDTLYDPEAQAPVFKKFINEICCNDPERVQVLIEIIGYALTRSIKAEKCFFFCGNGANGKSTLINVLHHLVGRHNISEVSLAMFSENFGLESMVGKYINIVGENEIKGKMLTEKLKAIISGDPITIPRKYKNDLPVNLKCKLIHVVNNLPQVDDTSNGYWRKVMLFPFQATFQGSKMDKYLPGKLKKECSGILNIALTGLRRLEENHYVFSHSDAISKASDQYQLSQKSGVQFITENYDISPTNRILKTKLFNDFLEWAKENGKQSMSSQKFWGMLEKNWAENDISYEYRKINGTRYLLGFSEKIEDTKENLLKRFAIKVPVEVQDESIGA